jgi:hypothetical protein
MSKWRCIEMTNKAAYNFEEFLRIMAEEGDNTNE